MNSSRTTGSASMSGAEMLDEIRSAIRGIAPWTELRGRARLQEAKHPLPGGNEVLVMHLGELGRLGRSVGLEHEWLVLANAGAIEAMRIMAAGAPDADIAAMLAWRARHEWETKKQQQEREGPA